MNILFSGLLLLSTNILQGYGQVISDSRDLTGTFNRNLTLSWTFSSKKDFAILTLTLYKDNTNSENKIYQGEESKELTSKGKAIFGERFVIEKNDWSAGVFISKLKNVQFNDTGRVFILRVVYEDGAVFTPLKSSYTITKVIGGPVACHDPLQSNYTFDENQSPPLSLTLCGVPKPTIRWTFNTKDISAAASSQPSPTVPYGFKYDVILPSLTQNVCGKTLTYYASGHSGRNILHGSSTIFINFQPSVIENIVFFEEFDSCNSVTWKALDVGDCSVTYTIEYLNSRGASIFNVTGITSQRDCNPQSKNASSVRVWAVYGDRIGVIGGAIALSVTTTTTTTTTTTVTTTKITASVGKTESDDGDDNIGVIVGVVCGVLVLIIIIIIIVIVVYCKKKRSGTSPAKSTYRENGYQRYGENDVENELMRPPSYHEEDEYVAIRNKRENPVQGLYAELGAGGGRNAPRPEPAGSHYAEVKLDAMGYPARGEVSGMPVHIAPIYANISA